MGDAPLSEELSPSNVIDASTLLNYIKGVCVVLLEADPILFEQVRHMVMK